MDKKAVLAAALAETKRNRRRDPPPGGGRAPLTVEVALKNFETLPDSALIPLGALTLLASESIPALLRKAHYDPRLMPVKQGFHTVRFRVGGVRQYLRGENQVSRPADPKAGGAK